VTSVSIRPVDLATTIQQTQHAERVNQLEHGQPRTQQHQFSQALGEAEKHRRESVEESPGENESRKVDDQERQGRQNRRQGRKRRGSQDAQALATQDDEPHVIDLRV